MSSDHFKLSKEPLVEYFEQEVRYSSSVSLDLAIALDNEFKDNNLNFETNGDRLTVSCYEHKPKSLIQYLLPEINRFINGWLAAIERN